MLLKNIIILEKLGLEYYYYFYFLPSTSFWGFYLKTFIHHYSIPLAHSFTHLSFLFLMNQTTQFFLLFFKWTVHSKYRTSTHIHTQHKTWVKKKTGKKEALYISNIIVCHLNIYGSKFKILIIRLHNYTSFYRKYCLWRGSWHYILGLCISAEAVSEKYPHVVRTCFFCIGKCSVSQREWWIQTPGQSLQSCHSLSQTKQDFG